jgi:uridine phosphorylase
MLIGLEFLKCMNTSSNVSINVCVKGIGAVEASVAGEDLAELSSFIANAVLHREIRRTIQKLIDA